eukprot:CAMPEP_0172434490 /NCGR_PEP_ID=MMETSP1064-20121228/70662_1 /TAXON_ID=202472 /ORGANISM="Aulacoseira subarctica , Strain CCAP 1002/5" /LENGTH=472 /DNA_ID=CAMNT_0013182719 /DNA_START=773 /DNA_END=2192 /DNA_ORIENTATION=-
MKNWLIFTFVCFYLPPDTYARVGHTNDKSTAQSTALIETNPSAQRRKLDWKFVPTQQVVKNDNSYFNYDDKEVPKDKSLNDARDFLRSTDVCYKNGSYSLSNCPSVPNCNWTGKFGPAKLCINRAPRPDNKSIFYVMVMNAFLNGKTATNVSAGWLIFTLVCFYLPPDTYARVGHTNDKSTAQSTALIETNPSAQRRKLVWKFVSTQQVVFNDNSYDDYDDAEIPYDKSMNDHKDFLRSTDVCYKNGSYSLSNCPSVPNCDFDRGLGPAKLCINRAPRPDDTSIFYVAVMKCIPQWENCDKCLRAPRPDDTSIFYVAVMKCIPQWENCDKCLCGTISCDRCTGARCNFNGDDPNDDYWSISCNNLKTIKFQKYSWTVVVPSNVAVSTSSQVSAMSLSTPTEDPMNVLSSTNSIPTGDLYDVSNSSSSGDLYEVSNSSSISNSSSTLSTDIPSGSLENTTTFRKRLKKDKYMN